MSSESGSLSKSDSDAPVERERVSVVVISYNRAEIIEACLRSAWFADELIVVDKSSTDGTAQIAARIAGRVMQVAWTPTVEETRALAVSQCQHDWVLCLDDDECLSLEAGQAILDELVRPRADVYGLPQRHYILGVHDENAYYWPEFQRRLFRKDAVSFRNTIHNGMQFAPGASFHDFDPADGVCIHHLSHMNVAQWLEKTNRYTNNPDRLRYEDATYDLAAFAVERIENWVAATKSADRGSYPTAVAVLRAIYDIIDRIKVWELEAGLDGQARFRKLTSELCNTYPSEPRSQQAGSGEVAVLAQTPAGIAAEHGDATADALRAVIRDIRKASELIEHHAKMRYRAELETAVAERDIARREVAETQQLAALNLEQARLGAAAELRAAQRDAARFHYTGTRSAQRLLTLLADERQSLAAMRAERDRLAELLRGHQLELHAAGRQLAEVSSANNSLTELATSLQQQLDMVQNSTLWRATWPLRSGASRVPAPARRVMRQVMQGTWSAAMAVRRPQPALPAAPLPALPPPIEIAVPAPAPASVPAPDRLSLGQLPPLGLDDFSRAIEWYDSAEPEVSIVILNWNRCDMTLLCLQHVWQRTAGRRYEIVVVDNGSAPHDLERLREGAVFARVLPLNTNRYFGEANNIGVEAARGRYICLLNNDAFVHEGWLDPLVAMLEADASIGAAGPRFLYPDGILQEAGALVGADGLAVQIGKFRPGNDPETQTARSVDYVSAACVLMQRDRFIEVLGFDLAWDPAYYEDVDLCLKLRLLGLKTYYCPASTVTHIEGGTSANSMQELRLDNIVKINRVKFVERWGAFLRSRGAVRPNLLPQPGAAPAPHSSSAKRFVLFTPYYLTPGGGERYLLTIAEALGSLGEVVLVTPHPWSQLRLRTLAREFGLSLAHLKLLTTAELPAHGAFDVCFMMGNEIVPPQGRMAATTVYICQFPFPIENPSYLERHRADLHDMAAIMVYSDFAQKHVIQSLRRNGLPELPITVLPPPVQLQPLSLTKKRRILHVGRFFTGGHCKRQDTLVDAFRKLHEGGLDAEFHLAGSINPEGVHRAYYASVVERAAGLPVFFHPSCSVEELNELYATSAVYWHATGFGADIDAEPHKFEHFGISVVEAMSAGCIPVVLNTGGPADIVEPGVSGYHFRNVAELCECTRNILDGMPDEERSQLSARASARAARYSDVIFKDAVHGEVQILLERQPDF